jgi:enoyl-CoA hydratase
VNRPDKLNAINARCSRSSPRPSRSLAAQGVRAAVLTGAGDKAFVAGADIARWPTMGSEQAAAFARRGTRSATR